LFNKPTLDLDAFVQLSPPDPQIIEAELRHIECELRDESGIEEIIFCNQRSIEIHADGSLKSGERGYTSARLTEIIRHLAKAQDSRIDPLYPTAGGQLGEDAHRWHALIPPAVDGGPLLSIRRSKLSQIDLEQFEWGSDADELANAMVGAEPILICGQAGSGKTSLLTAILHEHCQSRRAILIEQYPEIPILSHYWTRLIEKPPGLDGLGKLSLEFLIKEAFRLRPDVLVFGEIRGKEAADFAKAALSGHQTLATIHAASPADAKRRLAALVPPSMKDYCLNMKVRVLFVTRSGRRRQIAMEKIGF
jgi:pilus assembly protein CpaF